MMNAPRNKQKRLPNVSEGVFVFILFAEADLQKHIRFRKSHWKINDCYCTINSVFCQVCFLGNFPKIKAHGTRKFILRKRMYFRKVR